MKSERNSKFEDRGESMKNFLESGMGIAFAVSFVLAFGVFVVVFVKSLTNRRKDARALRLTVMVEVVAKRKEIAHTQHGNMEASEDDSDESFLPSTWYYVTFEAESGERAELQVTGEDYDAISKGDCGILTFQGERFLSFEPQAREKL